MTLLISLFVSLRALYRCATTDPGFILKIQSIQDFDYRKEYQVRYRKSEEMGNYSSLTKEYFSKAKFILKGEADTSDETMFKLSNC